MIIFEHAASAFLIWVGVLTAAGLAGWTAWYYLRRSLLQAVLVGIRWLFLLLLAWCLLLPAHKQIRVKTRKPRFLVVVDCSRSMQRPRETQTGSRWDAVQRALRSSGVRRLAGVCELEIHPFGETARPPVALGEADELVADADSTALRATLRRLAEKYRGQSVAGGLLLSDGLDTRESADNWYAEAPPWPLFTCRLAPEPPPDRVEPDVSVETVDTPRRVAIGWSSDLKAIVKGQGGGGAPVTLQLYREEVLVQEKPVALQGAQRQSVAFRIKHDQMGAVTYRVKAPPLPGERHTRDNEYAVTIQVVDAKNRLLYVEGSPRWESKYLVRALQSNTQIAPACFMRGPDGGFMAIGATEALTPDFTAEQLDLFKVVIIGNLSGEELGEARARSLLQFVESGGSLVLLGGTRGWGEQGLASTALKALMPATGVEFKPGDGRIELEVTEEGLSHPALAGTAGAWDDLPALLSLFPGGRPTPAAQVLMYARQKDERHPLIVTRPYGQGKVAAVFTDSLWRWHLSRDPQTGDRYRRFWNQLLACMSPVEEAAGPDRIDLFVDHTELPIGGTLSISARVGNERSAEQPSEMTAWVTSPDGRRLPYRMVAREVVTPSGSRYPGFGLDWSPEAVGLHRVEAQARVGGRDTVSDPVSFYVKPFAPEEAPLAADLRVLKGLAFHSEGVFRPSFEALNKELLRLPVKTETEERVEYASLWQRSGLIAGLVALLTLEWALRKWRNLP